TRASSRPRRSSRRRSRSRSRATDMGVPETKPEPKLPPIEADVKKPAADCFAKFVDAKHLVAWLPGLRRPKVVRSGEGGLPLEVLFEFGAKRTYSLVYTYDFARHHVAWRPGVGHRDAVRGWVTFEATGPTSCKMVYQLEPGTDRPYVNPEGSDPRKVVEGF